LPATVFVFVDDFLTAVFRAAFALRPVSALRTRFRAAAFVPGRFALFFADLVFAARFRLATPGPPQGTI